MGRRIESFALQKFVPEFGANFVLGLAVVTIRRSEACEIRHRFNIPYDHVGHVRRLAFTATMSQKSPLTQSAHSVRQVLTAYT